MDIKTIITLITARRSRASLSLVGNWDEVTSYGARRVHRNRAASLVTSTTASTLCCCHSMSGSYVGDALQVQISRREKLLRARICCGSRKRLRVLEKEGERKERCKAWVCSGLLSQTVFPSQRKTEDNRE